MKKIRTVGIVPFYATNNGEVKILMETVGKMNDHVDSVVVVDDGSGFLNRRFFERKTLVSRRQNGGKATAVKTGIRYALDSFKSIEVIAQIDHDKDQSPDDLPAAFDRLQGYDLIFGDRYAPHKEIPAYRYQLLQLQEAICEVLGFVGVRDTVSGLSAYTAAFAQSFLSMSQSRGWGLEIEKIICASLFRFKVATFPLTYSRLRAPHTLTEKLIENILDGILPHSQALHQAGKGMIIDLLEKILLHLERRQDFVINLHPLGKEGVMTAIYKKDKDVYTII